MAAPAVAFFVAKLFRDSDGGLQAAPRGGGGFTARTCWRPVRHGRAGVESLALRAWVIRRVVLVGFSGRQSMPATISGLIGPTRYLLHPDLH
jgi:hypothetical protein